MPTLTFDQPKRRGRPPGSASANQRTQDRRDAARSEADEATPTDPRLLDPVAMLVRERFDRAKRWRATDRIGPVSVDEALNNSYRQYHAILDPCDAQLVEDSGIDIQVSLTKHKVDVLVAWMRDLLLNSADAPFLVEPTPIPDLSPLGKTVVMAQMKQQFFSDQSMQNPMDTAGVIDMARTLKAQRLALEKQYAEQASKGMQSRIEDQLVEGAFRDQLMGFLSNFALYPFAVMMGPLAQMMTQFEWRGGKPIEAQSPQAGRQQQVTCYA
jgi:hypothetical protein